MNSVRPYLATCFPHLTRALSASRAVDDGTARSGRNVVGLGGSYPWRTPKFPDVSFGAETVFTAARRSSGTHRGLEVGLHLRPGLKDESFVERRSVIWPPSDFNGNVVSRWSGK